MSGERVTNASLERTLGRIEQKLEDLDKKVEHNCQVSADGDAAITAKIDEFIASHIKYHSKNEQYWGINAWAKKHLRATITLTIMVFLAILAGFGLLTPKVWTWVEKVNKLLP